MYEQAIEKRIRERRDLHDNQFSLSPREVHIDAVFILRQMQEEILQGNKFKPQGMLDLCGSGKSFY